MKFEERIVSDCLRRSGFQRIMYETDGNIPPDFSINHEIGVEVRRLSQIHMSNSGYKSLEEDRIKLVRSISPILAEFDQETVVESYWVVLDFKRPLGDLKIIKGKIRETLTDFNSGRLSNFYDVPISQSVKISFAKAGHPNRQRFRIGPDLDEDSGGSVVSMYTTTIDLCIKEKLRKIQPYLTKYKKWWLVLVDMIAAISGPDTIEIIQGVHKPQELERIIVIDPIKVEMTFEI